MTPDYQNAASKAIETIISYNIDPNFTDPLPILKNLDNVKLISYDISEINEAGFYCNAEMFSANKDAFSLASRINDQLKYIVIYNHTISPVKLRFALARELGHVILEHDGNCPEEVWDEEAKCFAYNFLCPMPILCSKSEPKPINFKPKCASRLWEFKGIRTFDSIDHMKMYVVDQQNRLNHFVGRNKNHDTEDVYLTKVSDYDQILGWKNCYDVVLDGQTVGYCGE